MTTCLHSCDMNAMCNALHDKFASVTKSVHIA